MKMVVLVFEVKYVFCRVLKFVVNLFSQHLFGGLFNVMGDHNLTQHFLENSLKKLSIKRKKEKSKITNI